MHVVGDAEQPTPETAAGVEALQRGEDFQEALLREILRYVPITRQAMQKRSQRALVSVHESTHGVGVTRQRFLDRDAFFASQLAFRGRRSSTRAGRARRANQHVLMSARADGSEC